mgnify:CR=1 FL=1
MKLRTRLALLIAGVIVAALLAQGFLGYLNFRQTARATVRNDLQNYLATLVHDRSEGDAPAYLPNENGIRARLIEGGEVVQEYGGPFPRTSGADGDDDWLIQRLPVSDLGAGAVVEASIPLRAYNEGLAAYLRTVLLSMGLMSVLGVGAALLVSRGVLRPLGDLLETAERVSRSGRLDERVAEPEGGGEIARRKCLAAVRPNQSCSIAGPDAGDVGDVHDRLVHADAATDGCAPAMDEDMAEIRKAARVAIAVADT